MGMQMRGKLSEGPVASLGHCDVWIPKKGNLRADREKSVTSKIH
jgi:hypothetical protein